MTATVTRLRDEIGAERAELAAVLSGLPDRSWDAPTLCAGWRVREVVAHLTMLYRYSPARFLLELARSAGRFDRMADRCARRDGAAAPSELVAPMAGGSGVLVSGAAQDLALAICGRRLPAGRLRGGPSSRFTAG